MPVGLEAKAFQPEIELGNSSPSRVVSLQDCWLPSLVLDDIVYSYLDLGIFPQSY